MRESKQRLPMWASDHLQGNIVSIPVSLKMLEMIIVPLANQR